jgi:transposase
MLDMDTRAAILKLTAEGHGARFIAKALSISRNAVKRVVKSGDTTPASPARTELAEPHAERILTLYTRCQGNLVRVQEELAAEGVTLAYSTLTGYCRRTGIGVVPSKPVGRYHFMPGEEMQHDTSPHRVVVGGTERRLECASLVLCHSRRIFAQCYPRWNRFWCKVFLSEAILAHVVLAGGSGADALIAPEMVAFATRYGFTFVAHEKGHAERSGRVERPFHYIEHNFYPGRSFADLADLNTQMRGWCDKANGTFKRAIGAVPSALFALERTVLKPLPRHLPAVEQIHERIVDSEGYVSLHGSRYSVDLRVVPLGHTVLVHEGAARVRVFAGHKLAADHPRVEDGAVGRVTAPEHRDGARWRHKQSPPQPSEQERVMRGSSDVVAAWIDAARERVPLTERGLRTLHRLWRDYPRDALEPALKRAQEHGLYDLGRIETMILRELRGSYFRLDLAGQDDPGGGDGQE